MAAGNRRPLQGVLIELDQPERLPRLCDYFLRLGCRAVIDEPNQLEVTLPADSPPPAEEGGLRAWLDSWTKANNTGARMIEP